MKKFLILILVLVFASSASAGYLDIFYISSVVNGGATGYDLTIELNSGMTIDGYDIDLTVLSGTGTFYTVGNDTVTQISGGILEDDVVTTSQVSVQDITLSSWSGPADIAWDFGITGSAPIWFKMVAGGSFRYDEGGGWVTVPAGTILLVPEPMTIALLGVGGLFLRRRR